MIRLTKNIRRGHGIILFDKCPTFMLIRMTLLFSNGIDDVTIILYPIRISRAKLDVVCNMYLYLMYIVSDRSTT